MLTTALVAITLLAPGDIRLTPGGQDVLRIPGLTRVALGREEVADVKVLTSGEPLVLGKQKGRTTMTLWVNGRISPRTIIVDDGRSTELSRLSTTPSARR